MSNFLTVEDINTTIYRNQEFYWHEIDFSKISRDAYYTDVKYDFCEISREAAPYDPAGWDWYTIKINNPYWTGLFGSPNTISNYSSVTGGFKVKLNYPPKIYLYMGYLTVSNNPSKADRYLKTPVVDLNLKQMQSQLSIQLLSWIGASPVTVTKTVTKGYNLIKDNNNIDVGYLLVNLVKSDFQFDCTQSLNVGQVNTVALGTDTDYKPSGDMIGANTPTIKILYNGETITAEYDTDDYYFDLDLTKVTEPSKVKFKVIVEANDVINHTETDITLQSDYATITTSNELTTLLTNGGTAKLGANITITHNVGDDPEIPINHDIVLIGNNKTINMAYTGFRIKEGVTFKAENVKFYHGVYAIYQETNTTVELDHCNFENCLGVASCIKCDITIGSLDNPSDFITILNNCTFKDNRFAILHGGNLTVNNCTITETPGEWDGAGDYPYFLYQTDGNADIRNSNFTLTNNEVSIDYDVKFYPCIFICGENAQINGYNHSELQRNNITGFLTGEYNNRSSILLRYVYDVISNFVTVASDNGFCHGVSGVDYVFKTNVTIQRS